MLEDSDLIFITCGMGGGTGTGAAPIIAEISKNFGILTIAIVTRPFYIEGVKRNNIANEGIFLLKSIVKSSRNLHKK